MSMKTSELTIVQLAISELKEYKSNPRGHPPKQIAMLKKSITRYGFNNPVLVGPDYELIAGHARIEAARLCSLNTIPAIILPHLNEAERRAFRIADNAIALKATWSMDLLRKEVEFLLDSDFEFEPDEIGFETGEFDFLLLEDRDQDGEQPQVPETRRDRPAVSVLGDRWTIGKHRVICGNSLDRTTYERLMGYEKAAAVVTDMPWNRKVNGEIGGRGKIQHPEFAMASGEMSIAEFQEFQRGAFRQQVAFSRSGAICLNFIDWRSVADMIKIGEELFTGGLINLCVWSKQSGGMGSMWRSRHELVCAFKSGTAKHTNNVMLGKYGRNRTNVWEYPAPLGWGADRKNLELHPTSKNVEMLEDAIMDITDRGDLVLDQFLGSGATILAAHKAGRIGYGVEIDPYYVDVSLERLIDATGEDAIDVEGVSFTERSANIGKEA